MLSTAPICSTQIARIDLAERWSRFNRPPIPPPRFATPAVERFLAKRDKEFLVVNTKSQNRLLTMKFADVYPLYVQKAKRKQRTQAEVDQVIRWLTGYSPAGLRRQIEKGNDFAIFFAQAPALHPNRTLITGVVCGVRVEAIEDPLLQNIRYLDKLIDELAKGKALGKILRA